MTAAAPTDLAAEILGRIATHTSKRPACAADVAALVGGDERAYWAALEQLKRECRINTAHIQRGGDPAPWLAIWPTGLPVKHHSWQDLNARGAFTVQHVETPRRFPQSPAARREIEENPMNKKPRSRASAEERRDHIARLVKGRPLANGLTVVEVADALGMSPQGVGYLIQCMLAGQRVAKGRAPGERAERLYDPNVTVAAADHSGEAAEMAARLEDHVPDATKMVDAPAAPIPQPVVDTAPRAEPEPEVLPAQTLEPADLATVADFLASVSDALGEMEPADDIDLSVAAAQVPDLPRAQMQFSLWDDGGLSIYDGDTLLQLEAADTVRLARLLGVPGYALGREVHA